MLYEMVHSKSTIPFNLYYNFVFKLFIVSLIS